MFAKDHDIHATPITEVMTLGCTTIDKGILVAEAVNIMDSKRINALLVVDKDDQFLGALNMHDLLRAGIIE